MTKNPKAKLPQKVMVLLKKGYPIGEQIKDAAETLRNACPDIFKKDEPYPIVRMIKFKEGEIIYEICEGSSRAKVGPV